MATVPALDRRAIPAGMSFSQWPAADGWLHRRYDWPADGARPRGSLLFQTGRAGFIEQYIEACGHWHERGWAISGFDWRGQGGSAGPGGTPERLAAMIDDLARFLEEWHARTPGPHVLVAHSMGGHVAMRLLAREGGAPLDAAVLIAPMLAINTAPIPAMLAPLIARAARRCGLGRRRLWDETGGLTENTPAVAARQRSLTTSVERFEDMRWWQRRHPDYVIGAPSWNWIAAAFDGTRALERPGALEAIRVPMLLLAAPDDRLVRGIAIERAARRLPDATLRLFPGSAHEILREADPVRLAALEAIDAFLDARAPAR